MPLGPRYRRLFAASTISNLGDGVGVIAYPWLASAITRNPLLIALVAVGQRLPWLVFTLPAGVLTDRHDRRRIMIGATSVRAVITLGVALAVLARQGALPTPEDVDQVVGTEWVLYVLLLVATLLLGTCEVLYDNSAQTFMPSIVETSELEKANGRLFSAETVANNFAGPPLAGLLLAVGFALPFVVDAASFAASAGLIMAIAATPRPGPGGASRVERRPFKVELAEGFRWLWSHDLLRTLAITLGVLNLLGNVSGAVVVLYGQEVLGTSVVEFAIYSTAGAVGGVVGGWAAAAVITRIGSGGSLALTLWGGGILTIGTGLVSSWAIAAVLLFLSVFTIVLWNVITVSLRQAIIPDGMLGRVNSVYRFFGWGAIPIGALVGGLLVAGLDGPLSRTAALRAPWILAGVAQLAVAAVVGGRLTTARIDAARAAGPAAPSGAVDPASR
ncbi:MAG: MFS transporter [Ilumatobacteraceae bacterium]